MKKIVGKSLVATKLSIEIYSRYGRVKIGGQ